MSPRNSCRNCKMHSNFTNNADSRSTVVSEDDERTPLIGKGSAVRGSEEKCVRMWKICCSVSAIVFAVLFVILGILVGFLFDPFISSVIDKELVIKDDQNSEVYKLWVDPPIVPYLKVYFFNLTNGEEFLTKKVKPIFKEVGPYSYRETWKRVNVTFHENGTVTYQTRKFYYFDKSESAGPENDIIHTLNVPVNVAVQRFSKMSRLVQLALSSLLVVLKEEAFVYRTVNDLVWGYSDPLITAAKKYLPKDQQMPFDKFGFFYQRNGSTDGIFNVYTGANGISNYTIIDSFNYTKELSYWNTPECNKINGTDGTSYPPHVKKSDTIYLFNENLCRSLPLIYNNSIFHDNIESYRFTPPEDVFEEVSKKPENKCFCVGGPPCIGGGVFNIGACKFNVSSILSWPHFYQADQKYLDAVSGLNPNPQKHSLYIDVNPVLGMPLSAQARIQINFVTMNMSTVKAVANLTSMVFPVMWFEDGIDKLPPQVNKILYKSTKLPRIIKASLMSVFFIIGLVVLVLGVTCLLLIQRRRRSNNLSITKESKDYESSENGVVNPAVTPDHPD